VLHYIKVQNQSGLYSTCRQIIAAGCFVQYTGLTIYKEAVSVEKKARSSVQSVKREEACAPLIHDHLCTLGQV